MRVLVTRPEPAASRIATRLRAAGHAVIVAPLLEPQPVAWTVPATLPEAVVFTSAAAARLGGVDLAALRHLPAFAVGDATATAVRAAGFDRVAALGGTAAALFAAVLARGHTTILHLAGADRSAATPPPGLHVDLRTVYAARLAGALPAAAIAALETPDPPLALLYSPRTAARFAMLADAAGISRRPLTIAAISVATAAAAGDGWRDVLVAEVPTEAALLAAAGLTCDKPMMARDI